MNDQKRPSSLVPLGACFDRFLFSPIGEDHSGMLLSVNSALARLNFDPWEEAAALARLPKRTATQRLATLIAALPSSYAEPEKIAERLIALLPQPGVAPSATRTGLTSVRSLFESRLAVYIALILVFIATVMVTQWFAPREQPTSTVNQMQQPDSRAAGAHASVNKE